LHNPQTVNPLPPEQYFGEWKKDYETMQEQMIYTKSPNFETMIEGIKKYISLINKLDWQIL
jgi:hypothetical protein